MPAYRTRVLLVSSCLAISVSLVHSAGAQNAQVNTNTKVTAPVNQNTNPGTVNNGAVNAGLRNVGAGQQNTGVGGNQSVNSNINSSVNANINTNVGTGAPGKLNGPGSQSVLNPGNIHGAGLKDIQNVLNTANDALQQAGVTDKVKQIPLNDGQRAINVNGEGFVFTPNPTGDGGTYEPLDPGSISATQRVELGLGSQRDQEQVGRDNNGNPLNPGGSGTNGSSGNSGGSGGSASGTGNSGSGGSSSSSGSSSSGSSGSSGGSTSSEGNPSGGSTGSGVFAPAEINPFGKHGLGFRDNVQGAVGDGALQNVGDNLNNVGGNLNSVGGNDVKLFSQPGAGAGTAESGSGSGFRSGSPFAPGGKFSGISAPAGAVNTVIKGVTDGVSGVRSQILQNSTGTTKSNILPGASIPGSSGQGLPGRVNLPGKVNLPGVGGVNVGGVLPSNGVRVPNFNLNGVKIPSVSAPAGGFRTTPLGVGSAGKPVLPVSNPGSGRISPVGTGGGSGAGGVRVPVIQKGGR